MKKQIERPGCTKAWSFLQPGRGQSPDLGGAGGLQSRNIRFGPSGDCRDCAKMAEKQKENRYKRGESRRREGGEEQEEKSMKYERIEKAVFMERPNRFIAYAVINGKKETIHVKNTGRCAELLIPGAVIYVQESGNPARKTKWDLIAVEKGERLINMDSQIPNQVVRE